MKFFSDDDVRRTLTMRECIEVMREAFRALHDGRVVMPVRVSIETSRGQALFMPASVEGVGLGQKTVTVFNDNRARGLPSIHALVTLCDPDTGRPIAVLEATYLTRLRTGAVTGLAVDVLAAPDARTFVIFGAGGQAASQIEGVCAARRIEQIFIVSRGESARTLARELQATDAARRYEAVASDDVRRAVEAADVVVSVTTSAGPVFDGAWPKNGALVVGVGAHRPDMREVDSTLLNRARVFADQSEAALHEAGDFVMPVNDGSWAREKYVCDLGALVSGHPAAHHDPTRVSFFKSCGLAVEDVCAAAAVLRAA